MVGGGGGGVGKTDLNAVFSSKMVICKKMSFACLHYNHIISYELCKY